MKDLRGKPVLDSQYTRNTGTEKMVREDWIAEH